MKDFMIVVILLAIVGVAVFYVIREKKKGVKCIGCPNAAACSRAKDINCGCNVDCESNCSYPAER